jgi:hypothetical protein
MNYSRKDNDTIISFLKNNDDEFEEHTTDRIFDLEILTIDDYARKCDVKDVWWDLCGMSEGGCANVWVVYDDGEKLVLGDVHTDEGRKQFDYDYSSSQIYIVFQSR